MAAHAGGGAGEFSDLLAHGELGIKATIHELDGGGRRFQAAADDVASEENAAMNGRTRLVVGEGGEEVRVSEHTGAQRGIELDLVESIVVMTGSGDGLALECFLIIGAL